MSIEVKCRFGKLQLLVQLNRDYLSKKPLFFRRQEDENFKEKNPFRQVPINASSHWPILQKDKRQNPLLWERQEKSTRKIFGSGNISVRSTKSGPENLQRQNDLETTMRSLFALSEFKSSRR